MEELYRGSISKIEVLSGSDVLESASIAAKNLYNFARYCAVGFNRKLARSRGHSSLAGKLPKYPGAIGMQKALMDTDEYKILCDRVASYIIRGFDQSMRSWFSNLKSNPDSRPPRYSEKSPPLVFEAGYGRNAKYLGEQKWRLTALSGNNPNRHIVARIYLPPLTNPNRVESIKILASGQCAVSYRVRQRMATGNEVAGIDLGIQRIVTLAFQSGDSILYHGGELLAEQHYWNKRIADCKPSGWIGKGDTHNRKSERQLSYYHKQTARKKVMLRALADSIVDQCIAREVRTIVIGNLKGIRAGKDYGSEMNQKLHAWPFAKLTELITNKAEREGIKVESVSEKNTSKTCSICGFLNTASARHMRGELECRNCGNRIHADVNGAFNILKKYLRESLSALGVSGGLPVQPSPTRESGIGELRSQIQPTFIAKFDLRNTSVRITRIVAQSTAVAMQTSQFVGV